MGHESLWTRYIRFNIIGEHLWKAFLPHSRYHPFAVHKPSLYDLALGAWLHTYPLINFLRGIELLLHAVEAAEAKQDHHLVLVQGVIASEPETAQIRFYNGNLDIGKFITFEEWQLLCYSDWSLLRSPGMARLSDIVVPQAIRCYIGDLGARSLLGVGRLHRARGVSEG